MPSIGLLVAGGAKDFLSLPVHPAFVHFPIAMFTVAWALILYGHARGTTRWRSLATSMEWIGVAFLVPTLGTGLRDAGFTELFGELRVDQPLLWHIVSSSVAAVAFTGHAIWRWRAGNVTPVAAAMRVEVGLLTFGFWTLTMTGMIAAEMIYG